MKYLLCICCILFLLSCNKPKNKSCLLFSIEHSAGLGPDTLYYNYNSNNTINYIASGSFRFDYLYSNSRVIRRNTIFNGQLIQSDSISYDNSGNIIKLVKSGSNSIEQTDFTYQNNKLVSAITHLNSITSNEIISATFLWSGSDITKILIDKNTNIHDSIFLNYSQNQNPFYISSSENILIDPEIGFTGDDFLRIGLFYSQHTPVSGRKYFGGGIFMPLGIEMDTNAQGDIQVLAITPTDESATYKYVCSD